MYRHGTDLLSLISGLILAGAAVITVFDADLDWTVGRWIGPAILVLIGVALLFPASRRLTSPNRKPVGEFGIDGQPLSAEALDLAQSELPPRITD